MGTPDDHDKLSALGTKIAEAEQRRQGGERPVRRRRPASAGMSLGLRVSAELIAALIVGIGIGWGLDRLLGTAPWLLVVFMFLGATGGALNAYRAARGMDDAVGFGRAMRDRSRDGAMPDREDSERED